MPGGGAEVGVGCHVPPELAAAVLIRRVEAHAAVGVVSTRTPGRGAYQTALPARSGVHPRRRLGSRDAATGRDALPQLLDKGLEGLGRQQPPLDHVAALLKVRDLGIAQAHLACPRRIGGRVHGLRQQGRAAVVQAVDAVAVGVAALGLAARGAAEGAQDAPQPGRHEAQAAVGGRGRECGGGISMELHNFN